MCVIVSGGTYMCEEPVYERLGLKECLIISISNESALVACNVDGEIVINRVNIPRKFEVLGSSSESSTCRIG